MAEINNGARRRKAFADFKETQYNDSFSLSPEEKRKKTVSRIFKSIIIVIVTALFIVIGFCVTDALMGISEKPYTDPNTYTAANTSSTTSTTTYTEESTEPSSESSSSQQETQAESTEIN